MCSEPTRVLLVDDEPDLAELAATFLERKTDALAVVCEESAGAALSRLEAGERFDCIVSDYDMPGMDGLEFFEALEERGSEIPFILFTGKGSEEIAAAATSAGVTEYLRKETGTEQYGVLAERIESAVAGSAIDGTDAIEAALAESGAGNGQRDASTDGNAGAEGSDAEDDPADRASGEPASEERPEPPEGLLESSPVPILAYRPEAITYVNDAALDFFGAGERADLLGASPAELVHPDDRRGARERLERVLGGECVSLDERFVDYDGETRCARVVAAPVPGEEGVGQTVIQDVGEDGANGADGRAGRGGPVVEESVAPPRLGDAFFELDSDWEFTALNRQGELLLDRSESELLGEDIWEQFPEAVDTVFESEYREAMESGGPTVFEAYYPPLETHFEVSAYPTEEGLAVHFSDVTERREHEAELEAAQARFRSLTENVSFAVVSIDEDNVVQYANDAVEGMFGYTAEELIGGSLDRIVPDRLERTHEEAVARYLREGDRRLDWEWVELPARHRSGREFPVGISFGEYVADGEHIFTGVLRDITDRKEREAELERYETLVQSISDIALSVDADGRVLAINEAIEELTGYRREELLGEPISMLLGESGLAEREAAIGELLAEEGREQASVEIEVHTAEGERIPCQDRFGLLAGENGEYRGTVGILRDISTQKERERELERSKDLLGKTQQLTNVGGWELDVATEELRWTEQVYRIHGLPIGTEPDLEGAIEFYHPEDRPAVEAAVTGAIEDGDPFDVEARLQAADGELRWVRAQGDPHQDEGETTMLRGAFQDVTERKEQQRRFEAIFNQTFQFTGLMEPDGTLLEANETALRFGGIDREAVVGEHIWESHWWEDSPEGRKRVREAVSRAREGEFVRYEQEVKGKEGTATIDFSIKPITDESGEVVLLIPEGRDISELKDRERELRSTSSTLSTLLGNVPVGVLAEDASREVLFANDAFTAIFGIDAPPAALVGRDCRAAAEDVADLFVDSERFLATNDAYVEGEETVSHEEFLLQDGRVLERSGTPIQADDQERADPEDDRYLWVYHDVTERVRREDVLETLHDRTREMMGAETRQEVCEIAVETAREALGMEINGIWLATERGAEGEEKNEGEKGKTVLEPAASSERSNELFETIPTYRAGNSLSWAVFETGEARFYADLNEEEVYNENTPVRSEIVLALGEQGVMNIGATTTDAFGEEAVSLAELLATNTEAALERAERERLLRNRERVLERQNERLDEFASIVSHDLRNPLTVASGRLELVAEECSSPHLEPIATAHTRMDALIEEALTLARQGLLVSDPEPVDLEAVLERVRETLGTPPAELVVEPVETFEADPERLRTLLENLLRNAVDHAGEDATVRVGPLEDRAGFFLADDGPGVESEAREAVFERGYSTGGDGTGLGLAIVENIVGAHGWEIDLTDSEMGGARFEIDFAPAEPT